MPGVWQHVAAMNLYCGLPLYSKWAVNRKVNHSTGWVHLLACKVGAEVDRLAIATGFVDTTFSRLWCLYPLIMAIARILPVHGLQVSEACKTGSGIKCLNYEVTSEWRWGGSCDWMCHSSVAHTVSAAPGIVQAMPCGWEGVCWARTDLMTQQQSSLLSRSSGLLTSVSVFSCKHTTTWKLSVVAFVLGWKLLICLVLVTVFWLLFPEKRACDVKNWRIAMVVLLSIHFHCVCLFRWPPSHYCPCDLTSWVPLPLGLLTSSLTTLLV